MKFHLVPIVIVAVLLGLCDTGRTNPALTFQDFYDALAPDGDWVELEQYGYCWRPFVDEDWRPYTDGQWVYTEAGYTWFSNEPWGWATYHYGRWTKVKNWGWVWVPGYEWGPAWVSWRANEEYIGWAALPPDAVWQPSSGFSVFVDIDYGIGPDWYAFCPVASFCAPRLRTACVPRRNNIAIIGKTENITRIRPDQNGLVFNSGPDLLFVSRRADTSLRRARLERETNCSVTALRERRLRSRLENDTLIVPAPSIDPRKGRPGAIAGRAGASQINRGWESAAKEPALTNTYRDQMCRDANRWGRTPHAVLLSVSPTSARQTLPPPGAPVPSSPSRGPHPENAPSVQRIRPQQPAAEPLPPRIADHREPQLPPAQQQNPRRHSQQQAAELLSQSRQQRLEIAEAERRRQEREARERMARAQQGLANRWEASRQTPQPPTTTNPQQQQQQQQQLQRQMERQREMQQRLHQQIQQQRLQRQRQNLAPSY